MQIIMPGYCVAGTVGAKVLAGKKQITTDKNVVINVKLAVEHLSFSAHADAKGIMQLIRQSAASSVVLVHGEKASLYRHARDGLASHSPRFHATPLLILSFPPPISCTRPRWGF